MSTSAARLSLALHLLLRREFSKIKKATTMSINAPKRQSVNRQTERVKQTQFNEKQRCLQQPMDLTVQPLRCSCLLVAISAFLMHMLACLQVYLLTGMKQALWLCNE